RCPSPLYWVRSDQARPTCPALGSPTIEETMRCFIKFLLAILAFAAIAPVAAQSLPPGPGRTVEVRPEGGGLWNLMHCKGLTPASADGSTGVVYRSNDGGETWY